MLISPTLRLPLVNCPHLLQQYHSKFFQHFMHSDTLLRPPCPIEIVEDYQEEDNHTLKQHGCFFISFFLYVYFAFWGGPFFSRDLGKLQRYLSWMLAFRFHQLGCFLKVKDTNSMSTHKLIKGKVMKITLPFKSVTLSSSWCNWHQIIDWVS